MMECPRPPVSEPTTSSASLTQIASLDLLVARCGRVLLRHYYVEQSRKGYVVWVSLRNKIVSKSIISLIAYNRSERAACLHYAIFIFNHFSLSDKYLTNSSSFFIVLLIWPMGRYKLTNCPGITNCLLLSSIFTML